MSSAKVTLIGFYNYYNQIGEDFFKNLSVPDEIDRTTLIAHILQKGGEFETLYSNPEMLMTMMSVWSTSWYHTIEKWIETMTTEYKPLENYDRFENWTDSGTENTQDTTEHTNITTGSANSSDTSRGGAESSDTSNGSSNANGQDNISAYNSSVMQPDTSNTAQSTTTATSSTSSSTTNSSTTNSSTTSNENINISNEVDLTKENNHNGRIHGNIGVTTSQQMAIEEMELRRLWGNIYDHVADLFLHEFVIPIYE